MSLGIIVTLLVYMAQRLESSMRPTTYASAASCRHIMVLPWKCKSYLPTSRAISLTNCEKGEFPDEELGALLELPDLLKSNCARPVLSDLHLSSLEEFLLGAFASHGQLELPPGWLLLTQCRWPSFCSHLGQLSGWQ